MVSGATPKTGVSAYWGGQIAWATPADLGRLDGAYIARTPRTLTEAGLRSCTATVLPTESVLLSSRAPIGHVALNAVPMATNQGFKSLVPQAGLNPKYLFYWLRAHTDYLQSLGNGATFKELSKKTVEQIEIPLPSVEEQRRIAAILDKADAIRAKRRQVLAHLDALTQSIFHDMFGDVRRNELGFGTATVADVADRVTDGEHKTPRRSDSGVPLLSARNVRDGWIDFANTDFVDELEYATLSRRIEPQVGDVLISCSGTIGRVAQVRGPERFAMVRSAALVRPGDAVHPTFLEHHLASPPLRALMVARANSSAQANLFQNQINRLPVLIPPLALQNEFASRVDLVRAERTGVQDSMRTLTELFASLQSRAFRGEL